MWILKEIQTHENEFIHWRHYFHENPEVSNEEDDTCEKISKVLQEMSIKCINVPGGGVLGFIRGEDTGKTVLLRADVDALPVAEEQDNLKCKKECVSRKDGVSHACGHDANIAMLLAAAKVLAEHREQVDGTVVLMFERGEEHSNNCIVLYKYLEDNHVHIDSAFGLHVYSNLPSGKVAINDGAVMSGNVIFHVKIKGKSGHGSRPDQAVNPIDCFVAIYNGIQSMRMRKHSPFSPIAFSIGKIEAGTVNNVIPEELIFQGTCRFCSQEEGMIFKAALTDLLDHVTKAYECSYEYELLRGPNLPVVNEGRCAALAREALAEVIEPQKICQCEPWLASEPFSRTLCKWPGVYALLGIQNEEKGTGAPHHNGKFDVDDEVLKYGVAAHVSYALAFLKSEIDLDDCRYQGTWADLYSELERPKEEIAYLRGEKEEKR